MEDIDPAILAVRSWMTTGLLDMLYRVERLEQAYGLASKLSDYISSERLPLLETDADQTAAMQSLETRLSRIEALSGE